MALLLTPRERETERQKEQERIAKESSTISRKVDELRELEQTSKKRLQEFQEKEFAKFTETKEDWARELDKLQSQIDEKKKELADYFEKNPIDKKWLLFVKTEKGNIETRQAELESLASKLSFQEKKQVIKDDAQAQKELELKQQTSNLAILKDSVESDKRESVEVVATARNKAQEILSKADSDKETADETLKKAQIVLREAELKLEAQDNREKEIEDRELAVIVQELRFYSPVKAPLQVNKPI